MFVIVAVTHTRTLQSEAFEGARYSIVRVFFAVLNLNVYLPPVALSVVELFHFELYVAFVVFL